MTAEEFNRLQIQLCTLIYDRLIKNNITYEKIQNLDENNPEEKELKNFYQQLIQWVEQWAYKTDDQIDDLAISNNPITVEQIGRLIDILLFFNGEIDGIYISPSKTNNVLESLKIPNEKKIQEIINLLLNSKNTNCRGGCMGLCTLSCVNNCYSLATTNDVEI